MSEELFVFNRRTVDDQFIYVRAANVAEAWRKARASDLEQTSDVDTVKVTLRRIPKES